MNAPVDESKVPKKRTLVRRVVKWSIYLSVLCLGLVFARAYFAFRDRIAGYSLVIDRDDRESTANPRALRVGFARADITPDLSNTNHPVWLAGFSQHRAATAVHDPLKAIACVIDDGYTRLGIVALDAIGFFEDDVVQVRRRLVPDDKLDYTIICSTHNHSTPDLMGLWGPDYLHTGVDPAYREHVIAACVDALETAAKALEPARVAIHEIPLNPQGMVSDTRKPIVFDPDIRVMHFVSPSTSKTVGTLIGWADHPETVWGNNTEVTADFCGYVRDAVEKGVEVNGQKVIEGMGGISLYVNGSVGGLMSTTPGTSVHDPFLGQVFDKPTHEKARAVGRQLAARILPRLTSTNAVFVDHLPLAIHARTIPVKLANHGYLLAGFLGLLDRGYVEWRTLRTEVAVVTLGQASIACVPGELYPEIANGGIEQPPEADFQMDPVEVPPLRALMPRQCKFIFGLANDEIGYLVPKTEWDAEPPFAYGAKHAPYGEINSVGPDAAGTIHSALKELCLRFKNPEKAF